MSQENKRGFSLSQNTATASGVLQIAIGDNVLSVTTIDGMNEIVVFSKSGDTISEKRGVTDFSDVIHQMWNLERLVDA